MAAMPTAILRTPLASRGRRHERIAAAALDDAERREQQQSRCRGADDRRRVPSRVWTAHQREDEQRDATCGRQRAGQVEPAVPVPRAVRVDQRKRQHDRCAGKRDIDEEHSLPAERAGQHAAEQHADDEPGRAGPAPDAQGAVARVSLRERRVDDGQCAREDQCAAESLQRARGKLELGAHREPAGERRNGVQHQARHEHPAPAEQVRGAPAEQQEAARCDRVGADDCLQRLRRIAKVAGDLGQRDDDDVLVEGHDQHRERQQPQRRGAATRERVPLRWSTALRRSAVDSHGSLAEKVPGNCEASDRRAACLFRQSQLQ